MKLEEYNTLRLIERLHAERTLKPDEYKWLLSHITDEEREVLYRYARETSLHTFSNHIYIRGLIEISNFCKNDCLYCGIRRSNANASRYRLTKEDILACCDAGYRLGFRTFVMQGGEDVYFDDDTICDIVSSIRMKYPDCAITLSLGERSYDSYKRLKEAGANRYLLRHETADTMHYSSLHPKELSLAHRMECLTNLKALGYQVGTGFMVGSPGQTIDNLAKDLLYIEKLQPQMVGIGPFVPHADTPFHDLPSGTVEQTVLLLAILRLMLPNVLLPATTALGTIDPKGREKGILAGANVVMPNLSPINVRKKYLLYDNKICTDQEAAEGLNLLKQSMEAIGYQVVEARGDSPNMNK